MKPISDYRAQARQTLEGRWNEAAIFMLIYMAVVVICELFVQGSSFMDNGLVKSSSSAIGTALSLLLIAPLGTSVSMLFLDYKRGKSELTLGNAWEILREDYSRILTATLVISGMVVLGIFTFGILSVYFALSYAMVPYLLRDYPDLTWREAMQTSREMMQGHKMEYFLLWLSFIGWSILAVLTLCIGVLWLTPYTELATVHFYEDLKGETIVEEDGIQEAEVVE